MRSIFTLVFAVIIIMTLSASKVLSQTIAIGHASAEVVESVSAASNAITSFELATTNSSTGLTSGNIDLGAITINSGNSITCNVVVKPASLTNDQGNGFTLDPSVSNNLFASAAQPNGSLTVKLGGKANLGADQAAGLYQGSYTVVIAYN
jgi:hypothetical protein